MERKGRRVVGLGRIVAPSKAVGEWRAGVTVALVRGINGEVQRVTVGKRA
jgi:hypothetical protein